MGLRGKVTLTLVIIVFIQISCKRCMPRTPTKSSLKPYLNNLKSVKNNFKSPTFTKAKTTIDKGSQNANTPQYSHRNMYETYNFPEIEYPLDTSAKDPFNYRMNVNSKYQAYKQKENINLQKAAVNDFKKNMKMQRKLSSYRQINAENYQSIKEISPTNYESGYDSVRFRDSGIFPEVQYPGNAMDSWGPNYWNYLPFTQDKQQFDGFGQQTFYPKAKEGTKTPLTKSKAYQFLQPYHKLKDEHKRISTESSKRSSLNEKGINFSKTPTNEKLLEDFITESIVSSISSTSSDAKEMLKSIIEETPSSNIGFNITEYVKESVPIPYKVITQDLNNNICPVFEQQNNSKVSYVAQTMSPTDKTMNLLDYDVATISLTDHVVDSKNAPVETLSHNDRRCYILPNNMTSVLAEVPKDVSTTVSPLNVTKPNLFAETVKSAGPINVAISHPANTAPLSNANIVPGSTSIIIIPINNAVGEPQSQFFETASDRSIIVYIPTSQGSGTLSQTPPPNQDVSSAFGQIMHNSSQTVTLNSHVLSGISAVSESPYFLGEIPTNTSSQKYETLPANSMCFKDGKSSREKSPGNFSNKTFTDTITSGISTCDEKLSIHKYPIETLSSDRNAETLPSSLNFEFLPNQLYISDLELQSDELPITAREATTSPEPLVSAKGLSVPINKPLISSPLSKAHAENVPLMHDSFSATQPIVTATDKLTQLMDKNRITTAAPDTTINRLPLYVDENLFSETLPISLSKTQSEDSQLVIDFPHSINSLIQPTPNNTNTDDLILPTDSKSHLATQPYKSEASDILGLSLNKIQLSNLASESTNDRPAMETIPSTIPSVSDNTDRLQLSTEDNTPTTSTKILPTYTDQQPLPMKKTQSQTTLLTDKLLQNSSIPNTPTHDLALPIDETLLPAPVPISPISTLPTSKSIQLMDAPLPLSAPVSNTTTNETSLSSHEKLSLDTQISTYFAKSSIDKKLSPNLVVDKLTYDNDRDLLENPLSQNSSEKLLILSDNNTSPINNRDFLESSLCDISSNSSAIPSPNFNEELELSKPNGSLFPHSIVDSLLVSSAPTETHRVDVLTNDKLLEGNNLPPSSENIPSLFENTINYLNESINQSLPKTMKNTDLETKSLVLGLPIKGELQDSPFANMSLDSGSVLTKASLLPMDKITDIVSGNTPLQNNDTQVVDHKVQNTSIAGVPFDSQSLSIDNTSSLPVSKVIPQLLPSNTSINGTLLPVEEVLLETPLLNTNSEYQSPLAKDSTSPDSPKTDSLTETNQALPGEKVQHKSTLPSDLNNTFSDSSVFNMASDLPSDNRLQSPGSDINNDGQPLDKAISEYFISNETRNLPKPLENASESDSTSNDLNMKLNKSLSESPPYGVANNGGPISSDKAISVAS